MTTINMPAKFEKKRCARPARMEFGAYFALIFMLCLPFAVLAWVFEAATGRSSIMHEPVSRAWEQAASVTPMIFEC
jgi:PufQ cytochrome subunit.